ncbi:MAG: PepSY domain-containing protein [Roseivivax sp.]|nr:PepSY domain-containing protein [Roseivivax sp.]
MTRILALALALAAAPVFASTDLTLDQAKMDEIRATLTEQGYDVRKIDVEDGMIEVYALKDGKKLELYLDETLKIVRTKEEN